MQMLSFTNYEGREETVVLSQVQSLVAPSHTDVHDHGTLVLVTGRRIALGRSEEYPRLLRELAEAK